jgi:hypothetical protein
MFTESCNLPRPELDETNQLHLTYSLKNLFNIILPIRLGLQEAPFLQVF